MLNSWKSARLAVALSLLSCAGALSASSYEEAQIRNLENRVTALEQRRGAGGVINPSARPAPADSWGIFANVDALLWNAHISDLPLWVDNSGSTRTLVDGFAQGLNYNWAWGFRVGLGYAMEHDKWDVYLDWTHFDSHGTRNNSAPGGGAIFPSFILQNILNPGVTPYIANSAKAHLDVGVNLVDLELGRAFYVSKWLSLRPSIGLRSAWLDMPLNIRYRPMPGGGMPPTISELLMHSYNRFWGFGPRIGLNTQWGLGMGFSLFGDLYGSLLYGISQDPTFGTLIGSDNNASFALGSLNFHQRITTSALDAVLGVRYDRNFYQDRYHFGISIGWENHLFNDVSQFIYQLDDVSIGSIQQNNGNLALQGWTLSVRFDF